VQLDEAAGKLRTACKMMRRHGLPVERRRAHEDVAALAGLDTAARLARSIGETEVTFTKDEKRLEAMREHHMRCRVYPRLVARAK